MKAIVQDAYGEADVLRFEDIDRPTPGQGELLVEVRAAGVDAGVWHLMAGLPLIGRPAMGWHKPRMRVRGLELAGRVAAVGAGVTRFKEGDEIFGTGWGAFAEYVTVREDRAARKPANLTFEQAAAVPVSACTALQALRKKENAGRVLVIGAGGGIGTYAVQLAKAGGAHVTGVCSTAKADLVEKLGAEVIDYTKEEITGTYDLILDIAGNRRLRTLREHLTSDGTLVFVGGENGGRWLGGLQRNLGGLLLSLFVKQNLRGLLATEPATDLERLRELIEAGTITPVLDRTFPLAEAADAVRYQHAGRVRGKVVVVVSPQVGL
ncbi:MAG TPA: NAD(P)-dependent alcohol dehydrogenase [Actinophytocola sp.]|jgi:NADPH:quinone reductase-like Zn-dependent oxidoreductase|uniref:NAD(P)-dependent alcohol dehydrogenase n=1 Tax=Actinophytocola sp. TaxID=1872138 RepID=UPI002F94DF1A